MNVNPTAYPVQQISPQQPYGYSAPTSRPPLQIQPQQSPIHNEFFPGSFPPNDKQQQIHHHHRQHQHQQQQHFQPQQAYQQLQQPSQSFYGNPGNPQFSGNALMPTTAPNGKLLCRLFDSNRSCHAASRLSYLPRPMLTPNSLSIPTTIWSCVQRTSCKQYHCPGPSISAVRAVTFCDLIATITKHGSSGCFAYLK